jgi:hypothetical protein
LAAIAGLLGAVQARAETTFHVTYETLEPSQKIFNFEANTTTSLGGWSWKSAGSGCGPRDYVTKEGKRQVTEWSANCEANLRLPNGETSLKINGAPAYTPYDAKIVYEAQTMKRTAPGPGEPFITNEQSSVNPATGLPQQTWTEELARCAPGAECTGFEPTGVELVRTITLEEGGLQATVEDSFQSTDGKSHTISVAYGEEQINTEPHKGFENEEPSYRFPGKTVFTPQSSGPAEFGGHFPATVYFETRAGHGEGLANPREALTLTSPPNSATFQKRGVFTVTYENRTLSSVEPLVVTHVLSQALTQAEVERLAHAYEERQFGAPEVAITAPETGKTVSTSTVQVSGTDSYPYPVASLTVNGVAATVTGGTWTATVPLHEGANTITATATNHVGASSNSNSIAVTYTPPPKEEHKEPTGGGTTTTASGGTAGFKVSSPAPIPNAVVALAATPSGKNGRIAVPVSCTGRAGQHCKITVVVTVRERLHGRTVVGLLAKAPSPTSRNLTIATGQLTIATGQSEVFVVALNRAGAALLAHHRALPAALHLTLVAEPGSTTLIGRMLTITAAPRGHRHK